ncbi:DUF6895 family protein [Thermodesulfobacteriota bacterium]
MKRGVGVFHRGVPAAIVAIISSLVLSSGCTKKGPVAADSTPVFLDENRPRYEEGLARARAWLDALVVDPLELRRHGIKGKKKLVELFDTYVRLHEIAPVEERPALMQRMKEVVSITYEPRYHDMAVVDDKAFKQDATSYLRAAYLMEGAGLDTRLYREEILKIKGRLDGHMPRRGPNQHMAFSWYYGHFGLDEPYPLAERYQGGVIAGRKDPESFKRMEAYHLTHEVFMAYQYGEKLDSDFFGDDDRIYLENALELLTVRYIDRRDFDLTGEFVSCMTYLGFTDVPLYRRALSMLLDGQNEDGTWGDYERYRPKYGDYVKQGWYLHTTGVVIDGLSIAFDFEG